MSSAILSSRFLQMAVWIASLSYVLFSGIADTYVIWWQVYLLYGTLIILIIGALFRVLPELLSFIAVHMQAAAHEHHDHASPTWAETGVHAVPLYLLLAIGPTVLGSHSLHSSPLLLPVQRQPQAIITDAAGFRTTDLLALRHDPYLDGGKITLLARVGELAEQTTRKRRSGPPPVAKPVLFRHLISCCAADGRPVYAWIDTMTPINLPIDSWVQVWGQVDVRETGGVVPVISVERWELASEPNAPYLILPGAVKQHP
jgi:hypothetical protein